MYMKCRNIISGLHILASNRIPESFLHADVLSNILYGVLQYLLEENMNSLLYGSIMNPYYNMRMVKSFIINNVLYMTIYLPLKHMKAPIMSMYSLHFYYMRTNMTDYKQPRSAYTKLQISHPYLVLSDNQFAFLDDSMDRNTIQYDHMYVQTTPILLFRHNNKYCYVNIIEYAKANIITSTCVFSYYDNISVHAMQVTTNEFFFLLNINS